MQCFWHKHKSIKVCYGNQSKNTTVCQLPLFCHSKASCLFVSNAVNDIWTSLIFHMKYSVQFGSHIIRTLPSYFYFLISPKITKDVAFRSRLWFLAHSVHCNNGIDNSWSLTVWQCSRTLADCCGCYTSEVMQNT